MKLTNQHLYILAIIVSGAILIVSLTFSISTTIIPAKCQVAFGCGGTSVLSWWDDGDNIGFFGNMSTIARGDNQNPTLDYHIAALFAGSNYTALADFMKANNAGFLELPVDNQQKFGALNYLSCIYQNETNLNTPLGTSPCERADAPIYMETLGSNPGTLNGYCSTNDPNQTFLRAYGSDGNYYCIPQNIDEFAGQAVPMFDSNATEIPNTQYMPIGGNIYMLLYTPISDVNGTCVMPSNMPSSYYSSTYYRLFWLSCTNGIFTQVYPASGNGYPDQAGVGIWTLANQTNED